MKSRPQITTSERELAIALAASGRMVSSQGFVTWRNDGLLPPLTSRGNARGRHYYWSEPNIVARAEAVYDALQKHGRTDAALITLWLSGFTVSLPQFRRAWRHRAKMQKPWAVRSPAELKAASLAMLPELECRASQLLLQAALSLSAAVQVDVLPQASLIRLFKRALSRLGISDGNQAEPSAGLLLNLIMLISGGLEAGDLVSDASDQEMRQAQRHLGAALNFLKDCDAGLEPQTAQTISAPLFIFILTLLRSGQSALLQRVAAQLEGVSSDASSAPAHAFAAHA